jgi:hypothetical protein
MVVFCMVIQATRSKDKKIQKFYLESMDELIEFYEFKWTTNTPILTVIEEPVIMKRAREGKELGDWVSATTTFDNQIYIYSPKALERNTIHKYSDKGYKATIKHELSHCFFNLITKNNKILWLEEGLSIFLAGQLEGSRKPGKFSRFLQYDKSFDENFYIESGYAVKVLLEKLGKKKFVKILHSMDKNNQFDDLFKKTTGVELGYGYFNEA